MGKRGEGWVIGQFLIGALIVLAPSGAPLHRLPWLMWLGLALGAAGGLIVMLAFQRLGSNLTAFPKPLEEGTMVQEGLYGMVRHPIYFGVLLGALGWALFRRSPLGLLFVLMLALWLFAKSSREERWLLEKYPAYREYQKRVPRLIPWLF